MVDLRLVAGLGGEQWNRGGAKSHAGLPWNQNLGVCVCVRARHSWHMLGNSPSSSVAPHPEIQHMVPASKSSLWFGRQMGSTNPTEDSGHGLQLPACSADDVTTQEASLVELGC